jgi:hypothetical protein
MVSEKNILGGIHYNSVGLHQNYEQAVQQQ